MNIRRKAARDASPLLRLLVLLLVASTLLIEVRFTGFSLVFPRLSVIDATQLVGAPFVFEWPALALAAFCAFLGVAGYLPKDGGRGEVSSLIVVNLLWCVVAACVALIIGYPQGEGTFGSVRMLTEGALVFICVRRLRWSSRSLVALVVLMVIVSSVHAMVILLSYLSPTLLPFDTNVILGATDRYAGLFMQPSRAGFVLGISAVFSMGAAVLGGLRGRRRLAAVALSVILLGGVLLSGTRGALVGLAVAIGGLLIGAARVHLTERRSVPVLFLVSVCMIAGVIAANVSGVVSARLFDDLDSGGGRFEVWNFAFQLGLLRPFGVGVGGLEPASGALRLPHAHNQFLQWLVMFGVIGLLLFVLLLNRVLRFNRSLWVDEDLDRSVRSARIIVHAAIWFALIAMMFEPFLLTNVGVWFWLVLGLAGSGIGSDVVNGGRGTWAGDANTLVRGRLAGAITLRRDGGGRG